MLRDGDKDNTWQLLESGLPYVRRFMINSIDERIEPPASL